MVHVSDPAGEFGRMMIREQMSPGRQLDPAGLGQRLSDQQVGRGVGFPRCGEMLADPGFIVAHPVGSAQHFKVPFVALAQIALGGMAGHQEQSEFHASFSLAAGAAYGLQVLIGLSHGGEELNTACVLVPLAGS